MKLFYTFVHIHICIIYVFISSSTSFHALTPVYIHIFTRFFLILYAASLHTSFLYLHPMPHPCVYIYPCTKPESITLFELIPVPASVHILACIPTSISVLTPWMYTKNSCSNIHLSNSKFHSFNYLPKTLWDRQLMVLLILEEQWMERKDTEGNSLGLNSSNCS